MRRRRRRKYKGEKKSPRKKGQEQTLRSIYIGERRTKKRTHTSCPNERKRREQIKSPISYAITYIQTILHFLGLRF
jgi:hypothetical protein